MTQQQFALSWYRPEPVARLLHKPPGRAVSAYPSPKYGDVERVAAYINSINPDMRCKVEILQ
jgi:hypothetical protein